MEIEFKRQQNLRWKPGDIVIIEWENSTKKAGKELFFVTSDESLFNPKTGAVFHYDNESDIGFHSGRTDIVVLEVFESEKLVLMLG